MAAITPRHGAHGIDHTVIQRGQVAPWRPDFDGVDHETLLQQLGPRRHGVAMVEPAVDRSRIRGLTVGGTADVSDRSPPPGAAWPGGPSCRKISMQRPLGTYSPKWRRDSLGSYRRTTGGRHPGVITCRITSIPGFDVGEVEGLAHAGLRERGAVRT